MFVDIFAVRTSVSNGIISSVGNIVNKRGMKLLGRAVFDVQDVLGSRNNVKARRLRNGGVCVVCNLCIFDCLSAFLSVPMI